MEVTDHGCRWSLSTHCRLLYYLTLNSNRHQKVYNILSNSSLTSSGYETLTINRRFEAYRKAVRVVRRAILQMEM